VRPPRREQRAHRWRVRRLRRRAATSVGISHRLRDGSVGPSTSRKNFARFDLRERKRLKKPVSSVFGAFGAAAEASPSPFFRRDRARF
jgi:hypothetical protein